MKDARESVEEYDFRLVMGLVLSEQRNRLLDEWEERVDELLEVEIE